jgi:hypothetical protein
MAKIHLTRHARERAAQRLCRTADLDLALEYGDQGIHGILVTEKSVLRAEREEYEARQRAQRLRRNLGLYLPMGDDGTVITVQRTTRQKRRRIMHAESFA